MTVEVQPHLQLSKNYGAEVALLAGDPKRVGRVKEFLNDAKELVYNREYRSVLGYYKNIPILVVSTGIGGPSMGIAIEELANIGVKTCIRIGSSGALQNNIKLGDILIGTAAVRDEGTTHAYINSSFPATADVDLVATLKKIANNQKVPYHTGIIRSHDTFYTDREEEIDAYWSENKILGADMETSTLFVLGTLRNLQTASILNVVVPSKGNLQEGINDLVEEGEIVAKGERNQILIALEAIASIHS